MDPSQQEPLSAVPPHVVNGTSTTQTRDQRERDNLYASIQSSASARQPIELARPDGVYSKPQTHKTDLVRGKAHMVNGLEEHARDPRDEASPPTPLATSRPQSPFTQHPTIDFDGLSWPSLGTRERKEATDEQKEERLQKLSGAVRTILECLGEDPDREGLRETPERYAKAMLFFTKGYEEDLFNIVNRAVFHEDHDELVIVKDIEVFSLCEHHLVPFMGKMHIGYIPNRRVLGLSKLARIAEMFARRLQVQERLTKQVALALSEVLQPQGVAVVMESSHLCMVMRGVEKTGSRPPAASLPGQAKSKGKRQASNSPLVDSSSPGLRRKRTKPNLKISPAEANSPFSPAECSAANKSPKTSETASAPEKASFGLGINGLSADAASTLLPPTANSSSRASPINPRGPLSALASSFGQLFGDAAHGGKKDDAQVADCSETGSVKKEDIDDASDVKMSGMEEDPYDEIMASLETAEPDKPLEDLDIGSPTPPSSPVLRAQDMPPNLQGRRRPQQQRMVFSMGEAIMSQNDILLNVCNFMGLRDFVNFYCVSKRFYVLVNSHYSTHMKQLTRNFAPLASTIFPYQLYRRACIRDPMLRTRPAHRGDAPSTYINPVLDGATQTLTATEWPLAPSTDINVPAAPPPEVVRTVPGLRWVLMCAYREAIVHDMLLCLAREGHRFPGLIDGAVLKVWALLDQPFNGTRLAVVHDARLWTNRDLFLALMFFIKLDMRFADPLLGSGECVLRRLLLGQRSLVVLWEALRGRAARTRAELLHMLVRWDTTVRPDVLDAIGTRKTKRGTERPFVDSVFGVRTDEVGALCREGWRQGGALLLRPDQLVLRETARRQLNMHRCFLDFMLWGHIDWTWLRNIPSPDLDELAVRDAKRRAGEYTAGPGGDDGERKISSGSFRDMARASKVSSDE
ncbi:gtp cyclohydrolase i [Diplodia corticola]|uniref:GTP cyclohydrolase 1 n=1 Tax=Diplodia corticola TaxID=236234 RepID=A0A1J9QX97_9PEZI|nr:gtp cyclohydrolase i [Diplodia corticola]OJD33009.1 gtp cyclohydrolase i [Diplodia corticola]